MDGLALEETTMNQQKTTEALKIFDNYLKRNTVYEGQVASSLKLFKKRLMNPILDLIRELEAPE